MNCSNVISNCAKCTGTATNAKCTSCRLSYLTNDNRCVNTCGEAIINCASCTRNDPNPVTCYYCRNSYYNLNNTCKTCSEQIPHCNKCKSQNNSQTFVECSVCEDGYPVSDDLRSCGLAPLATWIIIVIVIAAVILLVVGGMSFFI